MADKTWHIPGASPPSGQRRARTHAALLATCAIVGTVKRLAILRLDPRDLLARYGSDDMFYYTEVARHVAAGRGLSFDGVHATSGVQPLWLALLVPWAPLFEGHPVLALRIDLALVTTLTLVTGWLLPRVVQAVMGSSSLEGTIADDRSRALGTLAGCVWLVHPRILGVTFEGTEGALAALCWLLSTAAWVTERSPAKSRRLGVALGFGTLARVDHLALFATFLALPRSQRHSLRRSVRIALPVCTLWGAWLLLCVRTTGSFVPDSGAAKRLAQERFNALDLHGAESALTTASRPLGLVARQLWELVLLLFHTGGRASRFSFALLAVMTLSLGASVALAALSRVETDATSRWRRALQVTLPTTDAVCRAFGPVFLAAGAVLVAHVLVVHQLRNWYAMPAQLSITILASALCLDGARRIAPACDLGERPLLLVLTCVFWLTAAWTEEIAWPPRSWHPSYLAAAQALVAVTPAGARIGAFNAGILGAFASEGGRRVTNLDGVVNHGALKAMESRMLTAYIDDERIEFIADFPGTVAFEERIAAPGLGARLELVTSVAIVDRPGETLGIWRVKPTP